MPGPRQFAPLTRVGHESCPWPCGLLVWCNEPPDTKGNHHGTQQYRIRSGDNPPDFLAWHVANKGDKGFWTRIGAAWFHRDRKGLSLQLEVVPINGRIVLRTPLDDEKKEPGA